MIQYEDATYSYSDLIKKKIPMPGLVSSIGMIKRVEDTFVDMAISWDKKDKKCLLGLVIPRKAIRKIKLLS